MLEFLTFFVVDHFSASRRRRKMYCGHARLCVCLSVCLYAAVRPHYYMDPDVTLVTSLRPSRDMTT